MLTLEGLQDIRKAAITFDKNLEEIIRGDRSTPDSRVQALLFSLYKDEKDIQKINKFKEDYIKNALPTSFSALLPTMKISNQNSEERVVSNSELISFLDENSSGHLELPKNSKNYSIEFRTPHHGELNMRNPEITLVDHETNQKFVINCGICTVDWIKALNVDTKVKSEQLCVISEILKDKNGAIKVDCKNGVTTYIAETKVENPETHVVETKQVKKDNFVELMITVAEQYNKLFTYLRAGKDVSVNE